MSILSQTIPTLKEVLEIFDRTIQFDLGFLKVDLRVSSIFLDNSIRFIQKISNDEYDILHSCSESDENSLYNIKTIHFESISEVADQKWTFDQFYQMDKYCKENNLSYEFIWKSERVLAEFLEREKSSEDDIEIDGHTFDSFQSGEEIRDEQIKDYLKNGEIIDLLISLEFN